LIDKSIILALLELAARAPLSQAERLWLNAVAQMIQSVEAVQPENGEE